VSALAVDAAERMNRIYATQRYFYDLTRRPYLLGRAGLIAGLRPPAGGHVLEIGCGTAWNLIRAADAYPDARFYGLDVSSAMLETARQSIGRRGRAGRIALAHADATRFDGRELFGRARFDRVFVSYALSMIPEWIGVVTRGLQVLAPAGSLHIVDFGQCEGLPPAFRRLLYAWLARFSVTPIADFVPAVCCLAEAHGCAAAVDPLYRGYTVRAVLTRAS